MGQDKCWKDNKIRTEDIGVRCPALMSTRIWCPGLPKLTLSAEVREEPNILHRHPGRTPKDFLEINAKVGCNNYNIIPVCYSYVMKCVIVTSRKI